MSKYTQNRRAGGGPALSPFGVVMILATIEGTTIIDVTWSNSVNAADFPAGTFRTQPGELTEFTVAQISSRKIRVTFGDDIDTQTGIDYIGAAPSVASPQSIALT